MASYLLKSTGEETKISAKNDNEALYATSHLLSLFGESLTELSFLSRGGKAVYKIEKGMKKQIFPTN